MSYQVLARKWRPKAFAEVVGQKHVLQALINALDSNRLHHAYLFSGTRGVGKTTLGRIFAKSLNCEQGVSASPCGQCSSCREIDEGRFVDLLEVDAASRTKVDETRELLENVQYSPTRGRYKVYLIDEVHMLTTHSFNALLKTLEEPPPHVKFILATTDPQKLPVTILSRCLKFNLKTIAYDQITDHMRYVLEQEKIEAEVPALKLIARSALGSMRDALSLLDQAIAHGNGNVKLDAVKEMLGTVDQRDVHGIIQGLIKHDATELLNEVQRLATNGAVFSSVLTELISTLHQLAVAQLVPDAIEEQSKLLEYARELAPEDVQLYYQIALMGQKDLALAPDSRAGFEMLLLRMYAFSPDETRQQTSYAKPEEKSRVDTNAAPATRGAQVKQEISEAKSLQNVSNNSRVSANQSWDEIIRQLSLSGIVSQLANNSVLIEKKPGHVSLMIDPSNEQLASGSVISRLEQALSGYYGEPIKVAFISQKPVVQTPAKKMEVKHQEKLSQAVHEIENDPTVLAMKETFGAMLDPQSVKLLDNEN